ncbi:MAG TPA: hypothetical protein DEF04_08890 [Clostridiales bacterium]|nr:hypothetical protein [Clostridiales bacterium]
MVIIIMVIVIFSSVFFIEPGKQNPSDLELRNHYPYFEAMIDEELVSRIEGIQLFKWSKGILIFLGIEYVMLSIVNSGYLYGRRYADYMDAVLRFYHYSALVVFFTNKKDGKERGYSGYINLPA